MTVSKIHEYMTEKVVPESVMPQNIAACLMDEDATVPELDAFTFLNRVRALGIGSADFLYLLEGCGAPEQAVEKIKSNPAMNLQSLIVTLEESGLTSQDYTRMLYTARQIWERTLTVRLEKAQEKADDDIGDDVIYKEAVQDTSPRSDFTVNIPDDEYDEYVDDEDTIPQYDDVQHGSIGYQRIPRDEAPPKHGGKIIAAAVGSCVLIGLCAAMNIFNLDLTKEKPPAAAYATDHTEIFTQVYNAYNAGAVGGDALMQQSADNAEVFGSLLISGDDELGVYNVGSSAFAASPELITVYTEKDEAFSTLCTIAPPEGAEFIEIATTKELLAAVFADDDSVGFAAYDENGSVLYTCHQVGVLTDICTDKPGSISFGTVYTPHFTESFSAERTDKYLPIVSAAGDASTVPVQRIILPENSVGCSYAVYAEFSLTDGSLMDTVAVLGDPIYSDAEKFMAVMKNAEGCDIIVRGNENELITTHLSSLLACDMGNTVMSELADDTEPYDSSPEFKREFNVIATAEKQADGSVTLFLRGFDYEPVSAVTNIPAAVTDIRMSDGYLYIYNGDSAIMVLDIAEVTAPKIAELTAAHGIVRDEYALCSSTAERLVKLTLYKNNNGTAQEIDSYIKSITSPQPVAPEMCGTNTFYLDGEQRCAAAYTYFDGVSVISEYRLFGKSNTAYTLFDDKSGFTAGVQLNDKLYLVYGDYSMVIE
ncbi:MAG: hypothetical protein IJZ47_08955 [Oscillospiraceae bacterium]|nr:hypothetical protein [Oscillospiraceae bacterium]